MKGKAARDIKKLTVNATTISRLLGNIRLQRWIMLCPFLDDKDVIAHLRTHTEHVSNARLSFIHPDFHILVHSATDFQSELSRLRMNSLGVPLRPTPVLQSSAELQQHPLYAQLDRKFDRGFPDLGEQAKDHLKINYIKAHLTCANTLDQLRVDYPELWEHYWRVIHAEEQRLETTVQLPGPPVARLDNERQRLETHLSTLLFPLDIAARITVATGTLATWLIECPLDFSDSGHEQAPGH